ncbi:MAG: protein kinase, partial [Polyangiaceae bacterium]
MKSCTQCKLKYPDDAAGCFLCGGALVAIQDPLIGVTIAGRYQIEEVLGQGGMATVYAARHRLVDRPCAVKVMSPQYTRNEVIRERFRREAKAAQKLAHPNIIEIFDQGETPDGYLYLVMELLRGETLADVLEHGKVPLERGLPIMIQIARALARAHDLEVIHRDLKPEN